MASFLFGAATSAHQVEGNNVHNDWWAWEREGVARAKSGQAADHYNRFREDFALASQLGHTAQRFGIEWSRVEPKRGSWDEREITHYREVLQELRRLRLVSFVTLHHFTNPVWLAQAGGWENPETVERFGRYVEKVVAELGELVDFWITINEPMVYVLKGYWEGVWPPGIRARASLAQLGGPLRVLRVLRNLARAHRLAYQVIHERLAAAQVGMAQHFVAGLPWLSDWWFNQRFLRTTVGTHDFIGVNYYFPRVPMGWQGSRSDMGWPIQAAGLTDVLLSVRQYQKPIYVTENGVADAQDRLRADFIRDHVRAVEAAQAKGADVRGYLHWSLLDNFEWDKGFGPRFGLVEVDYRTMERRVRPSARVFQAIIQQTDR